MSKPNHKFPCCTEKRHKAAYDALKPTLAKLSQTGKDVIVTGGGAGIGAATALQAGASVVIGRRAASLKPTKCNIEDIVSETKIHTCATDVTHKDSINAIFKTIHDRVGQIHVFENNTGYLSTPAPIKDADEE